MRLWKKLSRRRATKNLALEPLENRVTPVSLVEGFNLLRPGDIGTVGETTYIAVEGDPALNGPVGVWVFNVDVSGAVSGGDITGLSLGPNAAVRVFRDINGDVVTNLNMNGTLSGVARDGSVLLESDVASFSLTGNLNGNFLTGGGLTNLSITGRAGIIATGSEAGGRPFDFNSYLPTSLTTVIGFGYVSVQGVLNPFTPTKPADINGVTVGGDLHAILAGDGAPGRAMRGGDILNIIINNDPDGYLVKAGDGSNGGSDGGRGGDVLSLTQRASNAQGPIDIIGGDGGLGTGRYGARGGNVVGLTLDGTGLFQTVGGTGGNGALGGGLGGAVSDIASNSTPGGAVQEPRDVVIADFNLDGLSDFAVANATANSVTVFLNQGNNNFVQLPSVRTNSHPLAIAAGDFDGDGRTDLATANNYTDDVTILRNVANPAALGGFVMTADFDGDGRPDGLSIKVGKGPTDLVAVNLGGSPLADLAVINGRDAATLGFRGDSVAILQNLSAGPGSITFASVTAPRLLEVGGGTSGATHPTAIEYEDFNSDGLMDLVITESHSSPNSSPTDVFTGDINVLVNSGGFAFTQNVFDSQTANPIGVDTGDFNGDGTPDIAVAHSPLGSATRNVRIFSGSVAGGFPLLRTLSAQIGGDSPVLTSIAVGNFNADGFLDIGVTAQTTSQFRVFFGDGDRVNGVPVASFEGVLAF